MDYLPSQGCRRIAYLAPSGSDLFQSGIRYDVYREKAAQAPILVGVLGPSPRAQIGPTDPCGNTCFGPR